MFLVDLGLLYVLVWRAHLHYLTATIAAYLVTIAVTYFLARRLVFEETRRGVRAGLVYFLSIGAVSAFALTPLMWLFVEVFHIDVIVSRIVAAGVTGVCGYLLNLTVNFRVARHCKVHG